MNSATIFSSNISLEFQHGYMKTFYTCSPKLGPAESEIKGLDTKNMDLLYLPNLTNMKLSFDLVLDGQSLNPRRHPVACEMIAHCLLQGRIWPQLGYLTSLKQDKLQTTSCSIVLKDDLLNRQMYQDLKNNANEIAKLNNTLIYTLDEIVFHIYINDDRLCPSNSEFVKLLMEDLNYLMASSYLQLESDFPLVFCFYSRSIIQQSYELMYSVQESLQRQTQDQLSGRRDLVIGFLKQVSAKNMKWFWSKHKSHRNPDSIKVFLIEFFNHEAAL